MTFSYLLNLGFIPSRLNINRRGHSTRHLHIFPMTKELPDCLLQSVMREKGGTVEKSRRDVQAGDGKRCLFSYHRRPGL